jgi:hypothetical protein
MVLTNAEKQAAWRARREEELRNLRIENHRLRKLLSRLRDGAARKEFHQEPGERTHAAYHEAGHAVIGLAVQLPLAYAVSVPAGRKRTAHVAMAHRRNSAVGRGYRIIDGAFKPTVRPKTAALDAFGNPLPKVERTPEEHRAEIVMCFAGPMAEAKLRNQAWRSLASSSDMSIARHHRGELGEAAQSWEEYEGEAWALVDKYWPMIEAVASRLMKVDWISGSEVDDICGRVARQQHFKRLRNR